MGNHAQSHHYLFFETKANMIGIAAEKGRSIALRKNGMVRKEERNRTTLAYKDALRNSPEFVDSKVLLK